MHYTEAKSILSAKNGMNTYRGCTHGCIYCDSRSACYHIEHEFTDIEVKKNAPLLLEEALKRKRRKCMIGTGSMCDPYMNIEKELNITRSCLSLIEKYGFGVSLLTKSDNVLRDIELLKSINEKTKCVVQMTLTTADETLCKIIEPNVCTTKRRFEVLCEMKKANIPTIVWLCPILPFINDTEENISSIMDYCEEAGVYGVLCFGMGVTLREGSREYFYSQLDKSFPGLKDKYIKTYGLSYVLPSPNGHRLMRLFRERCEKSGIICSNEELFSFMNEFTLKGAGEQLSLF